MWLGVFGTPRGGSAAVAWSVVLGLVMGVREDVCVECEVPRGRGCEYAGDMAGVDML